MTLTKSGQHIRYSPMGIYPCDDSDSVAMCVCTRQLTERNGALSKTHHEDRHPFSRFETMHPDTVIYGQCDSYRRVNTFPVVKTADTDLFGDTTHRMTARTERSSLSQMSCTI